MRQAKRVGAGIASAIGCSVAGIASLALLAGPTTALSEDASGRRARSEDREAP
jgi:hypothetical protein